MARKAPEPEHRSGCPISMSLEVFGDRWSLLIVRDLMFQRPLGYRDFAQADESIATNILADRLAKLEIAGIISRVTDPADGRRVLYSLTEKGLALAPVLAEIVRWGVTWEKTAAPPAVVQQMKVDPEGFLAQVKQGWVAGTMASIKKTGGLL